MKQQINIGLLSRSKTAVFVVLAWLSTLATQASHLQDSIKADTAQVAVIARTTRDGKILLRWTASTPRAWRKSNEYGYELKRYTVTRDNVTLAQPTEVNLGTFLPKPLEEWMDIIEKNDNATIIAQSLYGESFNVEGMDQMTAIVNLSEEQQQRFTWALYAADQDFEAAQLAGLAFVDEYAKANEKYLYRVSPLVPAAVMPILEGGVFTGLSDYDELPKPLDVTAIFMDQKAMLSWNYAIHKETYNSYFIERSEDGKNFSPVNDLPLTSLNNSERTDTKRMFYIDSISNNQHYSYRIKGRTPFGEMSPSSEVVEGSGEPILAYVPRITNKNYQSDNRILLEWEFLEEGNDLISGFELSRSDQVDGEYETIVRNIAPEARKIQYDSLRPTNYMIITAIGKQGGTRSSFPVLVQPIDSIPPVKPLGFLGEIDSLGKVTLHWTANSDKDILGYRLYRGNNREEEYSQITVSPHQDTVYYDSVGVQNLNSKVYYLLIAVDQRFNQSEPSDILEIKKPDFIPPTQPVFQSYEIIEGKVVLTWANSSSLDVIKHELYRKDEESNNWILRHTRANNPDLSMPYGEWMDADVAAGKQYSYTVIAIDDSQLESSPAPPVTVTIPSNLLKPPVERLSSYIDKENGYLELFWKEYKQPQVAEFMIYKGVNERPVTLMRNVPSGTKRIVDAAVKPNNLYIYMVRVIFKDGSMSEMANLKIKY